ncbi:hypothetical protein JIN86_00675 [Lysinibacillus sp. HST-98]|uniref:hypothetical protein n=1 Tax=Lysinibacillus TaxID=400634 RepID=UPI0001DA536A|nr:MULTISPECIES: hypothetical protein [Lysinibacillus]EFI70253.1 hypothetical protein BFZC1_02492 [Lysinibacillus fusiformis ZC1]EKU44871.1 hypothetical protein C518_0477 [Lysinibacillus fusiformis ZB2]MBL3728118.1 hypothetical protein [Lysinibacillus sp. HST-98]MBU5253658.1 hypothetical protein [Lysinibacillus capsici]MED4700629.1 hypothetical protein [Lysinibacillus capsici]
MKDQKKAKWILGTSGVILSSLLLTQFNHVPSDTNIADLNLTNEQSKKMSDRERELVQLDWTNFEIVGVNQLQQPNKIRTDRTTKRS